MTLALWLDPSDAATVTLSGTRVTDVADKSPAGNDVAEVSTSGPEIAVAAVGGLDVLNPAAADYLARVNASLTNMDGPDFTVFAVITDNGVTAAFGGIIGMTNSSFTVGWRLIKNTQYEFSAVDQTPRVFFNDEDTAGEAIVLVGQNDETHDYQWAAKSGIFQDSEPQVGANVYSQDLRICTMPGSNYYPSGYLCEFIYFDGTLRSDDIQRVEGYLAHKWRDETYLPAGHPFKYRTPDIVNDAALIAEWDGADGATSYTSIDSTGRTATFTGNAAIDQNIAKFASGSLILDGSGDYVSFPSSVDFAFGTGDFTIEFWMRPAALATYNILAWGTNSAIYMDAADTTLRVQDSSVQRLGGGLIAINTWYHVALCRLSGTDTLYLDGVAIDTDATGTSFAQDAIYIGQRNGSTNRFNGHIAGVRIVKGTALYTNDFVPPHRPFRAPLTAEFIANFNGQDAATAYTSEDAGARTATFNGNAQLDDAQRKFGHTALLLDGTGDYVTFPDSADFEFAGGDFTAEGWFRWSTDPVGSIETLFGKWGSGVDQEWLIYVQDTDKITLAWTTDGNTGATLNSVQGNFAPVIDTWYHIAVERFDDLVTFWVDGVVVGKAAVTETFHTGAEPLVIGGHAGTGQDFTGWIDGVRILKGTALRSRILPPDYPLATFENTAELLINFEGNDGETAYTSDDSVGRGLTFSGGAALDDAQRAIGGTSLRIPNVNGDLVTVPSAVDLALGSGDFTIECRVRLNSINAQKGIYDQRTANPQVKPTIYIASNNTLRYYVNGADRITGGALAANIWYHIVVERVDGVTRMYIDGVQTGTGYTDASTYVQDPIVLGNLGDNDTYELDGWIDMVRVSVGTAIYGGDFDVPVAAQGGPVI